MSQTIESDASDEECENVDPPEPGIESQFQSKISSEMKELNLDTVTDVRPEVKPGSTLVSDVAPINAEEAFDIKVSCLILQHMSFRVIQVLSRPLLNPWSYLPLEIKLLL